jgi:NAD(P)-dependent dehydrogenase (short-subunit alcohol dehydrogenase family)
LDGLTAHSKVTFLNGLTRPKKTAQKNKNMELTDANVETVVKDYEEQIDRGLVPQKRMGEPADVARVVRAIAEGSLDYATGQVLDIDGGFHLRSL